MKSSVFLAIVAVATIANVSAAPQPKVADFQLGHFDKERVQALIQLLPSSISQPVSHFMNNVDMSEEGLKKAIVQGLGEQLGVALLALLSFAYYGALLVLGYILPPAIFEQLALPILTALYFGGLFILFVLSIIPTSSATQHLFSKFVH